MRLRYPAALALASSVFAIFVACSGADPHPGAGSFDSEGGANRVDSGINFKEAGDDATTTTDSGTDAGNGCNNSFKDGNETDTDCGGNVCGKCVDGKTCIKDSDCAGNACIQGDGGTYVCKTASCTDGVKNGDETDIDCGGAVCPHCNIGRACAAGTDCTSKECSGNQCGCPPNMAIVSRTNGTSYCVDSVEVTKGQYNKFVAATVPTSTQPAFCSANTTFIPRGAWPPLQTPDPTQIAFSYSIPVHYVDWCDGYAYCKWAGKQLCGQINGGPVATTDFADATKNAWYNACSAQGLKGWGYANSYDATLCNVTGVGTAGSVKPMGGGPYAFGYGGVNQDDGTWSVCVSDSTGGVQIAPADDRTHASCSGGAVNLYQTSGNVAEWEDSCDATAGASDQCRLRGGSYAAAGDSAKVRCDADRKLDRVPAAPGGGTDPLADVGFRCCVY